MKNIKSQIKQIDASLVSEWFLYKHYAGKKPSNIMFCYWLFIDGSLVWVATFWLSANYMNNKLWDFKTVELTRLIIDDCWIKNILSSFLSWCLKLLPSPISVISYADKNQWHNWYIYQATNWIYTWLWAWTITYKDKHWNIFHSKSMWDIYKNDIPEWFTKVKNEWKHRYYYLIWTKKQRKKMMYELMNRYEILPYPKWDNVRYEISHKDKKILSLF
jgi:hypothetical protein